MTCFSKTHFSPHLAHTQILIDLPPDDLVALLRQVGLNERQTRRVIKTSLFDHPNHSLIKITFLRVTVRQSVPPYRACRLVYLYLFNNVRCGFNDEGYALIIEPTPHIIKKMR